MLLYKGHAYYKMEFEVFIHLSTSGVIEMDKQNGSHHMWQCDLVGFGMLTHLITSLSVGYLWEYNFCQMSVFLVLL